LATTAAKLLLVAGAFLGAGSCVPAGTPATPAAPPGAPEPTSIEPEVRIGLKVRAASVAIGGAGALVVSEPDGTTVAQVPPGEVWRIVPSGRGLAVGPAAGPLSGPYDALALAAGAPGDAVRIDGRSYRGIGDVLRDTAGVTVVNRLPIEQYLLGVVSAEMGRRLAAEQEALRAQAVASRTYAMRNIGRWRTQGFDLYATVSDQVYNGVTAETPEGTAAVEATRGLVLTYGGAPIDAFFYSTCGGRTAEGGEVFRGALRPYLRSISDVAADGLPYCQISPRYHWREEWSGAAMLSTLRRTLPAVLGVASARVRDLRDLRVVARTGSGRVDQLAIGLGRSEVQVAGRQIRQVLRAPSGEILRSNAFTLAVSGAGRAVRNVVAEGSGAGHGVGLCQWGAVGRARAGQRYDQILAAYYAGTSLERLY
jgi:stage II sporulation protein D